MLATHSGRHIARRFAAASRSGGLSGRCSAVLGTGHTHARFYTTQNGANSVSTLLSRRKLVLLGSAGLLFASYSLWAHRPIGLDAVDGIRHYTNKSSNSGDTITLLSDDAVDKKLRAMQQSYNVTRGKGVVRYDVAQLPSNNPIEDNHVEQVITVPAKQGEDDLYFFGIFDGHSGPFTSAKLSRDMVRYVAKQLSPLVTGDAHGSSAEVDTAISSAFVQLDNDIVQESFRNLFKDPSQENMASLLPAISGSCALLSLYNSSDKSLKVAVTGDSRALIGSVDAQGNWTTRALSTDQTGDNAAEVQRIQEEHPGEPNAVCRGRVLGCLQPSRAFGDYRYKVNSVDGHKLNELPDHVKVYFRSVPRDLLTPPYVTARPEVTTTAIDNSTKFMVMGSDGLFELLTNEEIAGLVVRWSEKYMSKSATVPQTLPAVSDLSDDKEAQRPAFRYKKSAQNNSAYILEDANVATHLIRNALSAGGQKSYVSTLASIPEPMSRKYRDDLTVTVVFFGDEATGPAGTLVLNPEATTPPAPRL